ncbi:hypothetical protein [Streptomyces cyaneofuscatus]|uniref:hypothetical protein n=1 Tax=Streptomyces cyaneofuscatus TaxID=66883 RepID=UPI0037D2DC87
MALAIRTVLEERRNPGSASRSWRFLRNTQAVLLGSLVFVAMTAAVFLTGDEWGRVVWAVLAGLLTAFIADELARRRS